MRAVFSAAIIAITGCGGDEPPIEPTYENVAAVVTRSCTFSGVCHGDPRGSADLNYASTTDITTVLNSVPSCQYDLMPRVDPGNPENSWIMVKLDGMHDEMGEIQFTPADGFMPPETNPDCDTFGGLMPSNAMPTPLPMREVELFRSWIRAGAPGPSGG
jgi:hypothetical protein